MLRGLFLRRGWWRGLPWLLAIEGRIGELLPSAEEAKRLSGGSKPTKRPAGVNLHQAHAARAIANNPDIVDEVIAEAEEKVLPVLTRWKGEAKDMVIPELWNAHEHLGGRGGDRKSDEYNQSKNFTFDNYCTSIGITRQTGRNWLITAVHIAAALQRKLRKDAQLVVDALFDSRRG